jgi:catechol 2,3-dioxygenase
MRQPIDPRVEIGHVRLAVADLDRAIAFYQAALGFEVTHRAGSSAAFLGAGGVHRHIALRTADATQTPTGAPYRFALRYPDRLALANALARLDAAAVAVDRATDDGFGEALHITDPDGHQLELYYDRPQPDQAREGAAEGSSRSGRLLVEALRAAAARPAGAVDAAGALRLSDAGRQRLRDLRTRLLHLHKVLLEDTRAAYELDRGRVGSNANLLQLVINDPWFAWLHSLSEMVVRIDEAVEPDSPATQPDAALLVDQVERLLTASESGDGFARRYYEALQRQPAVVLAHADVRRTLKGMR